MRKQNPMATVDYHKLVRDSSIDADILEFCNNSILGGYSHILSRQELFKFVERVQHLFIVSRRGAFREFPKQLLTVSYKVEGKLERSGEDEPMAHIHRLLSNSDNCIIELDFFLISFLSRFVGEACDNNWVLLDFKASDKERKSPKETLDAIVNQSGIKQGSRWNQIHDIFNECSSEEKFLSIFNSIRQVQMKRVLAGNCASFFAFLLCLYPVQTKGGRKGEMQADGQQTPRRKQGKTIRTVLHLLHFRPIFPLLRQNVLLRRLRPNLFLLHPNLLLLHPNLLLLHPNLLLLHRNLLLLHRSILQFHHLFQGTLHIKITIANVGLNRWQRDGGVRAIHSKK